MIALVQRVTEASIKIDDAVIAKIAHGMLVMLAVEPQDSEKTAETLLQKLMRFRIFADQSGKMNLDITQTNGEILLVPQFTLAADTKHGNRPSFAGRSASSHVAESIFSTLVHITKSKNLSTNVESGKFGANMQVSLTNDGPVTFWIKI